LLAPVAGQRVERPADHLRFGVVERGDQNSERVLVEEAVEDVDALPSHDVLIVDEAAPQGWEGSGT
jgi:hypothetical protein